MTALPADRPAPASAPCRIPLPIQEPGGIDRHGWPVTQGIPLPDHTLPRQAPVVVLDPDGQPLPTQSECLTTWGSNRRFVKWLLVDFPCSIKAQSANRFLLVGGGDSPPPPAHPASVSDSGSRVRLSNGLIEVDLQRNAADFFKSLRLLATGGEPRTLLSPQRRPHLHLTAIDKQKPGAPPLEFASDIGPLAPLIEVEAAGPIRASVLVSGYHFSADGLRFCPYRLRIHLYAGRPDLRIEHTFIFDQAPERFALTSIALRWPLAADRPTTGWIGTPSAAPVAVAAPDTFGFIQSTVDTGHRWDGHHTFPAAGSAPGWISRGHSTLAIGAFLNETAREFPVGLRFTPDALSLDFWPAEAGPLDFTSPFAQPAVWIREPLPLPDDEMKRRLDSQPHTPLDLHFARLGTGPEALDRCDRLRRQLHTMDPHRPYAFSNTDVAGACGMAKTHRAWLSFAAAPPDPQAAATFSGAVREPLLALPEPEQVCASGAVRLLHPCDPTRFPATESALADLFEQLVLEPERVCSIAGKFDYGDLINGHNVNNPITYRAFRRQAEPWTAPLRHLGVFNNESQDVIRQLWCFYLRTGRRDYFRFAEAKSRHTEDVDFVHRLPRDAQVLPHPNLPRRCEGQMHYHSATHWSGPYVTSHSLVSGIVTHYLLTGDRRAREVALAMADSLVRNQTPNGLVRESGLHRELTGAVCTLLEACQLTGSESYRALALNTLALLRALANPTGNLPTRIFTGCGPDGTAVDAEGLDNRVGYPGGMLWYVLYDAWALFPEPWIREWILQLAEAWVHGVPCDDVLPAVRTQPAETGLSVHEIAPGWLWHSWLSFPNFFFDPLVALAWKWTGQPRFLGYLVHRARVFPDMARDAARLFTGHTFNVLNHCGESVPSVLAVLAEAGEGPCRSAYAAWIAEREADGFPVFEGPWSHFDGEGTPRGPVRSVTLRLGSPAASGTTDNPAGRVRFGAWNPQTQRFE
jgi:hypothetical protein